MQPILLRSFIILWGLEYLKTKKYLSQLLETSEPVSFVVGGGSQV
jgi:hypothetical protein